MCPGPEISVVVPTYRRPRLLAQCLESLKHQRLDHRRFEVVVVDDASGDETENILKAESSWPQLITLVQPANAGPAAARNRGVREARAPLLLFFDDDMVASPDLVESHLRFHEGRDDQLGVLGLVQWHPDLPRSAFMNWLATTDLQFGYEIGMAEGVIPKPWERFYTCNVSLSRRLFLEAGGFDERFPYPAHEDTDLALRLVKHGFHLEYRPGALAWHSRPITLADFCRRMEQVGESTVILEALHAETPSALPADTSPSLKLRLGMKLMPLIATLIPCGYLRSQYFRLAVHVAFLRGVKSGRARLLGTEAPA